MPTRSLTGHAGPILSNEYIARVFDEIADLLDIEQANPFRIRAYRNAARSVRACDFSIDDRLRTGAALPKLPAIGADLAGKIDEICRTGSCTLLERLHQEVPASLTELMHLPAIGPKRARQLFHELGIDSLSALQQAAERGQLQQLAGFGPRLELAIAKNLQARLSQSRRFLLPLALAAVQPLLTALKALAGVSDVVVAGSARRWRETVGDIDLLVKAEQSGSITVQLAQHPLVDRVLAKGPQRATVLLRDGLQVDVRIAGANHFGAALQYLTGSKAHSIALRRLAQARHLKLNEYGLFAGNKQIAGKDETEIYQALGLDYIAPELREDEGELAAAAEHCLPTLVCRADLRGDLHAHTRASDGQHSLADMAAAAKANGLRYLAITEHSQHLAIAHGLSANQLMRQIAAIDELNTKLDGITLLKGVEVDILADGSLDLPDSVLAQLDVVVAALHSQLQLPRDKQTLRVLRAMESRYFTVLAHPTGRLLGEREGCDIDMVAVIRQARQRGCFLELNAQPQRMDLAAHYCRMAKAEGVLISIGSDAHRISDFGWLEYGIGQARRGWLTADDILNTRALPALRKLLRNTRL